MKLTATSDRLAGALKFGREFRKALAARGRTTRGFAIETGISRTRMQNWLSGESLPPVEMSSRLADLLMWPRLADLAKDARTRTCDECGRSFHVESPTPQRYCSPDCKRSHAKVAAGSRDLQRAVLERRVRRYRSAVASMCRACEPGGLCQQADCPLQLAGVSPLPLSREAVA